MRQKLYVSILLRRIQPMSAMHELLSNIARILENAKVDFGMQEVSEVTTRALSQGERPAATAELHGYEMRFSTDLGPGDRGRFAELSSTLLQISEVTGIEAFVHQQEMRPEFQRDILVEELALGNRVYNIVKRAGIQTLADITQKKPSEFKALTNMGDEGVAEIIAAIEPWGLRLQPE